MYGVGFRVLPAPFAGGLLARQICQGPSTMMQLKLKMRCAHSPNLQPPNPKSRVKSPRAQTLSSKSESAIRMRNTPKPGSNPERRILTYKNPEFGPPKHWSGSSNCHELIGTTGSLWEGPARGSRSLQRWPPSREGDLMSRFGVDWGLGFGVWGNSIFVAAALQKKKRNVGASMRDILQVQALE